MTFIDSTAVNVALPVMQGDLGATAGQLQWVVEGYALFLSSLLLIGGALGDRFGQRRVFIAGIALFAVASAACGFAPSPQFLIIFRCVQGAAAAIFVPGSLALITEAFSGTARGAAIGTWSGASAITTAIGPALGGWLAQSVSWRAVFFINLPLALFVLVVAVAFVRDTDHPKHRRLDIPGASLATAGLGLLTYALISLQTSAKQFFDWVIVLGGCALLVAFAAYERRARDAMLPPELFASHPFVGANLYTLLLYAALGGALYFLPFELINVQHYTPLDAGLSLLPFVIVMSLASRWSGALVSRIGGRLPLAGGALLATAAFAWFALTRASGPYFVAVFPGALLLGCAGALFVAPLTTIVMNAANAADAGIASGINNAAARVAGLIAVAALGLFLAFAFDLALAHQYAVQAVPETGRAVLAAQHDMILAGHFDAHSVPADERLLLQNVVSNAYAAGFAAVMGAAAALCALAALLAAFWDWGSATRP